MAKKKKSKKGGKKKGKKSAGPVGPVVPIPCKLCHAYFVKCKVPTVRRFVGSPLPPPPRPPCPRSLLATCLCPCLPPLTLALPRPRYPGHELLRPALLRSTQGKEPHTAAAPVAFLPAWPGFGWPL